MKRLFQNFVLSLAFAVDSFVHAAVPDPVDPRDSVNYTFEQRMAQTKQLHAKLKEASAAERLMYFDKSLEAVKKLSAEERRDLSEKFKSQWKKLTDDQKKQVKQEARNYITSLPDAERKELKRRRELMLEFMSPEERKHWP